MATEADTIAWLSLWRVPRVGARLFRRVLDSLGDLKLLYQAGSADWAALGFSHEQIPVLKTLCGPSGCRLSPGVETDLAWLAQPAHHLVTWLDDDYPALLREIDLSPPLLFVRGVRHVPSMPQIAIVGTRQPSRQGRADAHGFSRHFARQGFATTSGMARGIDAAAHEGALDGGGLTIGVMAHGLDSVYPPRHRALAERVCEQGALISEFPIGVTPSPSYFPRRNRIISGLSMGVLVVEAALKSGSLITAREATQQGRDVFAVPGSIHNPLSKGCHALIRQGALLVETGGDVTQELTPMLDFFRGQVAHSQVADEVHAAAPAGSPRSESLANTVPQQLVDALSWEVCSVDELVAQTGLAVADITTHLLMLELDGVVVSEFDGYRLASANELG